MSSKRKTDNGIYSCRAKNRFGAVYSKNASLVIGSEWFPSNNNYIFINDLKYFSDSLGPAAFNGFLVFVKQVKACTGLVVVYRHCKVCEKQCRVPMRQTPTAMLDCG